MLNPTQNMKLRANSLKVQEEQKIQEPSKREERTDYPGQGLQISRKFSLLVCTLLVLTMSVFSLLTTYNSRNILKQQADILGQNLAAQTAVQVTELVLARDLISMNVVLNALVDNSTITEISVVDVNNEIIARALNDESGFTSILPFSISLSSLMKEYTAPISIADSIIGYVRLELDNSYIEGSMIDNLVLIIIATLLLLVVAAAVTSLYYKYLVDFPISLLSFYIGKIRSGEVETCPVPKENNELSAIIRQFNATAEFLAQNTFLKNIGVRQPRSESINTKDKIGLENTTILLITMSNFQYLASTLSDKDLVAMLNKYYFFSGKISQLYNGNVCFCSEDEVLINFSRIEIPEEQAFYAICSAQLFLQLFGEINPKGEDSVKAKFRLAIHSGNSLSTLYSPITQKMDNLSGRTLDMARMISRECPSNSIIVSEPALTSAGAGTRVEAEDFGMVGESEQVNSYIALEPMSEYKFLLQKQTTQLLKLYNE